MVKDIGLVDVYNDWIQRAESERTKYTYEYALDEFIKYVFYLSDVSQMTVENWANLTPITVSNNYVKRKLDEGNKNSTIKQQLRKVSSFVTHISKFKELSNVVDVNYIKNSCLDISYLSDDTKRRVRMGDSDVYEFIEWLKFTRYANTKFEHLGEKYALVAEFMFKTATRKRAVFDNVHWSDIIWESDSFGNFGYNVYILSKGNKVAKKAIPNSLYEDLKEEFFKGDLNELVFSDISYQMFGKLTREFGKLKGIEYTPHSIKVGSVTAFYNKTKDLVATSEFADHEDTKTTLGYIRLDDNRMKKGGIVLSQEVDFEQMKDSLDVDQLWSIIKADKNLAMSIAQEAERRMYAEGLIVES